VTQASKKDWREPKHGRKPIATPTNSDTIFQREAETEKGTNSRGQKTIEIKAHGLVNLQTRGRQEVKSDKQGNYKLKDITANQQHGSGN